MVYRDFNYIFTPLCKVGGKNPFPPLIQELTQNTIINYDLLKKSFRED